MRAATNVVIAVMDGMRADRLGLVRGGRSITPFLDGLAGSAAVFDNLAVNVPATRPSCASLLSGMFPLSHGLLARRGGRLSRATFSLPEALGARGYRTAAIDDLVARYGWFGRGFQARVNVRTRRQPYPDSGAVNARAIAWLREHAAGEHAAAPFLLYLRYCETHTPYTPPARYRGLYYDGDPTVTNVGSLDRFYAHPINKNTVKDWLGGAAADWPGARRDRIEDVDWVRAQYDAGVRAADDAVAELAGELARLGVADRTALIVVGDHGESLGEHGIYFDHHGLYEPTLRAPLVVAWPGVTDGGRRVAELVQMPDLAPTVLDLLGAPVPAACEGKSLRPLLGGEGAWRRYSKVVSCEASWMFKWAYRVAGYKLIVARAPDIHGMPPMELYELASDPDELHDLARAQPEIAAGLRHELERWLARKLRAAGLDRDPVAELARRKNPALLRKLARRRVALA